MLCTLSSMLTRPSASRDRADARSALHSPRSQGGPLPEQEQALADIATLNRWWITQTVLADVAYEREVQFEQWGDQDIPLGTSKVMFGPLEDHARKLCQRAQAEGTLTYREILLEEVYEALAEEDPAKLYDELIETAAVAVKMAELVRRRLSPTPAPAGQADSA